MEKNEFLYKISLIKTYIYDYIDENERNGINIMQESQIKLITSYLNMMLDNK